MSSPILDAEVFTFKSGTLYSQTVVTDFKVGEVVINTPMTDQGGYDELRPTIYMGRTTLNINGQMVPVQFKLEGETLTEALADFPNQVIKAVDNLYNQQLRNVLTSAPRNTKLDVSKIKS